MIRIIALLLTFLAVAGQVWADDIETVRSWAHYRELMIEEGDSEADADAQVERLLASLGSMDRSAGDDRIGVPAPSFEFDGWLNSEPLTLEDLRGQVVLVRWWTETCPFCASSTPALLAINDEYSPRGLTVVGVYHPKADRDAALNIERVERAVAARGLDFPIAIDWDWRNGTLADWWLTGPDRPATSVTFLLDKSGVIQYVHPGMEYHEEPIALGGPKGHMMCANDMVGIRAAIERLLAKQ
ncbi:TlpA family protein disulfide reductase [Marinihelvus fidelis]|uniref:TlpA family protein disulfide reductase n=1 Tax=Marinihelvus fidelis TaxID=2613842 RepID=A0A5N0TI72_9GAMM|nr:TlpA disulfide reductase family protein [Marinihelvus fidelis]KAA9133566.1 TlpA family protein disulfide reductase [Marinihelvus fidelis]